MTGSTTPDASTPAGTTTPRVPRPRAAAEPRTVRVLVAVGTDKHPFDRLVEWLRDWHAEVGTEVALTVQHGHTAPATVSGAVPFLGHDELQRAMADADLVVCHGGPATILEARRHGRLPIVVPRDPGRGEHVDDHQQLFARRLGAAGMVALCETREALLAALRTGVAEPGRYRVTDDPEAVRAQRAAVERVGGIVEELVAASAHRRGRWWQRLRERNGDNNR
ncbi:glycosyltransferase [Micromonospora auratinigra]|uniref:UDP-N-acetylglucosamine transferase subunit ALG13 n=1 Tax=Micromonospora auratinigra TaxID=261654 RepID=A0A1A8Z3C9_9ACTN|nr:glycosyltransferase [Micromonospora auratinigra]SBT38342.1 UDP-N-acetylglucosamine transferase subunit ALG13 [Micromonospora auratinigra]